MLPKINRIKKKKDFEIIFKNSRSFKDNLFIFKAAKNNLKLSRVGFVVSQKISKKATVRNKVRRRLAGALEKEIKNIKNGTDIIIIALPGIEKKDFSQIKTAVSGALIKNKCLNQ